MSLITTKLALGQNGPTITVQAWTYAQFSENYADFRRLLAVLSGHHDEDGAQQMLLDRVLLSSVPQEQDRQALGVLDLPDLLETVAELNHLTEVTSKARELFLRLVAAEGQATALPQEAP